MLNISHVESRCGAFSPLPNVSYVTAFISAVLCLVTVPGNLLICMAVYYDPYRRLRTPFNIVVANLAFADLIVGCITEPLSVYLHVKEAVGREIAIIEIRSLHLSYFISCTASVLSMSLLALERYMAISYSFKYRLYFKVRRFVLVSLIAWLVAIGLSMVYFLTSYIFYTFVFINIAVFWTFCITTFCYVKILRKMKRKEIRARQSSVIANVEVCDEIEVKIKASAIQASENRRTTKGNAIGSKENAVSIEECGKVVKENGMNVKDHAITESKEVVLVTENAKGSKENAVAIDENRIIIKEDVISTGNVIIAKKHAVPIEENTIMITDKVNAIKKDVNQSIESGESSHELTTATENVNKEYNNNKYNILVTKTYIIVSVMFLACYIPALMIIYTMNWCETCSCIAIHIMRDLQFLVVIVNSSINPFLYAIRFSHFRRAISKILQVARDEVFY